ncbi:MAG: N-acetyl-gamma-glutamyl-phosphate reductase [Bacteroidales bacterium]|nr:N-acetyl-gamma-glutamyl-phosphate reductase [Bacteroidales bacterium]
MKTKVGIVGATGYTGSELVRILVRHPEVEIVTITSESRAGEKFSDVHPFFRNIFEMELEPVSSLENQQPEIVFLALPHGISMEYVKRFENSNFRIIDFSGDFRLDSPEVYESWYKKDHSFAGGFKNAVYGLPELFRAEIENATLVANPGCFPTGAILGITPLLSENKVSIKPLIVDSKTGVTGSGVKAKNVTHFPNVSDNFKPYGMKTHRHTIEIQQILDQVCGTSTTVQFTPHLLPVDRGIISTIYLQPTGEINEDEIAEIYRSFYQEAPFVRICPSPPSLKDVRGTNYCDIYHTFDERTGLIMVVTAIDNLVKGAAGQAVQNMNIMLGLDQSTGLHQVPLNP